jgi:hypothetical protein
VSFRWIYRDTPKTMSGESEEFASQEAAEDFMGEAWRTLLDAGHLAATLMNGDEELYTMKLTPE